MPKDSHNNFLNDYSKKANIYAAHSKDSGTLLLAYREFGRLFHKYITSGGNKSLDYGTGTGRSRRYLEQVGFDTDAVDIDPYMLDEAKRIDADNAHRYFHIENGKIPQRNSRYDLVFSSLVVLEINSKDNLKEYLLEASRVLRFDGTLIVLTVNDDFYKHQWISVDTDYPGNNQAQSGDKVKIRIKEIDLELEDYYWTKKDYIAVAEESGFSLLELVEPKGNINDEHEWISEVDHSPYSIFVFKKSKSLKQLKDLKSELDLEIDIEGKGVFSEIHRDPEIISKDKLSSNFSGDRNKSATLRLLMKPGDRFPFHKSLSKETLKHIEGNDLIIHLISETGEYKKVYLGEENDNAVKKFLIPENYWYAEEVDGINGYCLLEAITSPAFHPDDVIETTQSELLSIVDEKNNILVDTINLFFQMDKKKVNSSNCAINENRFFISSSVEACATEPRKGCGANVTHKKS